MKLVFDDHTVFDAERKLQRALGRNPRHRSFAILCEKSCRGTGGEMHGKVYLFGRAGAAKQVTMVGSNNMTSHNAERQWSDLVTLTNNKPMYTTFRTWFGQLKWDRPVAHPADRAAGRCQPGPDHPAGLGEGRRPGTPGARPGALPLGARPHARAHLGTRVVRPAWHEHRQPGGHPGRERLRGEGVLRRGVRHRDPQEAQGRRREAPDVPAQGRQDPPEAADRARCVRRNDKAAFVWTGSHNWSPWALKLDDVILRSSNRGVADAYTRHFAYMFDHA